MYPSEQLQGLVDYGYLNLTCVTPSRSPSYWIRHTVKSSLFQHKILRFPSKFATCHAYIRPHPTWRLHPYTCIDEVWSPYNVSWIPFLKKMCAFPWVLNLNRLFLKTQPVHVRLPPVPPILPSPWLHSLIMCFIPRYPLGINDNGGLFIESRRAGWHEQWIGEWHMAQLASPWEDE